MLTNMLLSVRQEEIKLIKYYYKVRRSILG